MQREQAVGSGRSGYSRTANSTSAASATAVVKSRRSSAARNCERSSFVSISVLRCILLTLYAATFAPRGCEWEKWEGGREEGAERRSWGLLPD